MHFIVYSKTTEATISTELGQPEYSYYFVLKQFLPVLDKLGTVLIAADEADVRGQCEELVARQEPCVFLHFSAPHNFFTGLPCPSLPVFAWEFDTIPCESWAANEKNDWRIALRAAGAAITHSQYTVEAVRNAMGQDFPILSLPCGVWDDVESVRADTHRLEPIKNYSLRFTGILLDSHHMALGQSFEPEPISGSESDDTDASIEDVRSSVSLQGVIYTSLFNPYDLRKNWQDMLTAFCWAFRDTSDATLLIKISASHIVEFSDEVAKYLARLAPLNCRVIVIKSYLEQPEYNKLIAGTSYYVNTSFGEGQCLPLMEFLSAGIPAVAPASTALADYMNEDIGFLVHTQEELSFWQHDERQSFRTMQHRVVWRSLYDAFTESYKVAKGDIERYASKAEAAISRLEAHCSRKVLTRHLESFITSNFSKGESGVVPQAVEEKPELAHQLETDPLLRASWQDSQYSGWHNNTMQELVQGFRLEAGDTVVDVGCGEGGNSAFCAMWAEEVIYCDLSEESLSIAQTNMRQFTRCKHRGFVANAEALDLESSIASKVICTEVLEHVEDPLKALSELHRIGKSDCLYLLTVPDELGELLQKEIAPPEYFQKPNHIRILSREAFDHMVEEAGFVIEDKFYSGFYQVIWWTLFWDDRRELLEQWAELWLLLMSNDKGRSIKAAFDKMMPKSQMIIARKA
ncbi:methyltransferase domain-containing protein [Candidatus Litorirhabdus singularis]|nr:methyltransferase domain-containing protein [Candidatus Litorirhabdus singularis]